ncbi:unnamed protein product [Discosporangium mesarthrocarpum]
MGLLKVALLAAVSCMTRTMVSAAPEGVRLVLRNQLAHNISVYWINVWNRHELVPQQEKPTPPHGQLSINSYVGHSFLVVDTEHTQGLTHHDPAELNPTIMTSFTMTEFDMQVRKREAAPTFHSVECTVQQCRRSTCAWLCTTLLFSNPNS